MQDPRVVRGRRGPRAPRPRSARPRLRATAPRGQGASACSRRRCVRVRGTGLRPAHRCRAAARSPARKATRPCALPPARALGEDGIVAEARMDELHGHGSSEEPVLGAPRHAGAASAELLLQRVAAREHRDRAPGLHARSLCPGPARSGQQAPSSRRSSERCRTRSPSSRSSKKPNRPTRRVPARSLTTTVTSPRPDTSSSTRRASSSASAMVAARL